MHNLKLVRSEKDVDVYQLVLTVVPTFNGVVPYDQTILKHWKVTGVYVVYRVIKNHYIGEWVYKDTHHRLKKFTTLEDAREYMLSLVDLYEQNPKEYRSVMYNAEWT